MTRGRRVVALSSVRLDPASAHYARALANRHSVPELLSMLSEKAAQANDSGGGLNLAWHLEVHAMRCALQWRLEFNADSHVLASRTKAAA